MNTRIKAKEHILAGDIFQIVLSQRFESRTFADPFEIYRALRVVYMAYLQARGCILVASSPEILTRVKKEKIVNCPLVGTARRGRTLEEDEKKEAQLLKDEKQCEEHIMLVDLGRKDVGKVSKPGSVKVERLMNVARYLHVMHISSTVTGELDDKYTCWDALQSALPVGTVSGAPKVKAMELIDQLEVTRRRPYSGGFGGISFLGAWTLRSLSGPSFSPRAFVSTPCSLTRTPTSSAGNGSPTFKLGPASSLARSIDLAESTFVNKSTKVRKGRESR